MINLYKAFGLKKASEEHKQLARLFHDTVQDHHDEMVNAFHHYTDNAMASRRYELNPREVNELRQDIGNRMGGEHKRLTEIQNYLEDRGIDISEEARQQLSFSNSLQRDMSNSPSQDPNWGFDPIYDPSAEGGYRFSESSTHATRTPDQYWNVDKMLRKAFGIRKESIAYGNPETYDGYGTPPHPQHEIYDRGWGNIPESRGTLVSEPTRNLEYASEKGLVHGTPNSLTPHEAVEAAVPIVDKRGIVFYVADDGHMVSLQEREDGKPGMEVRHNTHGGRANRLDTKEIEMGRYPRALDLRYRDVVANHWIKHFKNSPHVTQGLPLLGGLDIF